jgi:hypothetical protein
VLLTRDSPSKARQISAKKVKILFITVKETFKKNLDTGYKYVQGMRLTTHTWQNLANQSFQSLTIYYISKDLKPKKVKLDPLQMPENNKTLHIEVMKKPTYTLCHV